MDVTLVDIDEEFAAKPRLFEINEEAFPEEERIPSGVLLDVMRQYGCRPLAMMDGEEMVGFTALVPDAETGIGYIWYFAVAAECRGRGYGSLALRRLQEMFADLQIVLDMEPVDAAAPNYAQRLQRLHFYQRNGFARAHMAMRYFGMTFEIMSTRPPFREEAFRAFLAKSPSSRWRPVLFPLNQNMHYDD